MAESGVRKVSCKQSRNSTQNWTFPQAVLYNSSENSHPKVLISIRKDLGTKC